MNSGNLSFALHALNFFTAGSPENGHLEEELPFRTPSFSGSIRQTLGVYGLFVISELF